MLLTILLAGLVVTQRTCVGMLIVPNTFNYEEIKKLKFLSKKVCELPFSCPMFNDLTEGVCECGCEDVCEASDDMNFRLDAVTSHAACSDYTHLIKRSYFVHTKCKPGSSQDLIADCKAMETFKDVIWVTDKTSNEHYRNIACATCNGVSVNDMIPWILHPNPTCKHYANEGQQFPGGTGGGLVSGSGGLGDGGPFGGGLVAGGFSRFNFGIGSVTDCPVDEVTDRPGVASTKGESFDVGQTGAHDGVSESNADELLDVSQIGVNDGDGESNAYESFGPGQIGVNDGLIGSGARENGFRSISGSAGFVDFMDTDDVFDVGGGFAAPGFSDLLVALTIFGSNSVMMPNDTLEGILNFLGNYTANGCLETFQPPDDFDPMNEYCQSRTFVSSCKASFNGSIGSFDLLERACEEHLTPMAAGGGGVVYKNSYCFLCNTVNPGDIDWTTTNRELEQQNRMNASTDDGTGSRGSRQGSLEMYIVFIFQFFVMVSW